MNSGRVFFAPSDERLIFWISWVFLITQYPQKVIEKHIGDSSISPSFWGYGYILLMLMLGLSLWKLFHKERFISIKNVVVGLQGFFLFHLFLFTAWLSLFLLLATFFGNILPQWISSTLGLITFYAATFLGGCWIGYKNERLFFLWCIVGVAMLYYGITWRTASFKAFDIFFILASILISIAGGYFGTNLLKLTEN
jgi:hypothetical protein